MFQDIIIFIIKVIDNNTKSSINNNDMLLLAFNLVHFIRQMFSHINKTETIKLEEISIRMKDNEEEKKRV